MDQFCKKIIVFFGVAAAAYAVFVKLSPILQQRHGISISQNALDLRCGFPGEELTGTIRVINTGRDSASFSVLKSCGCTTVEPDAGVLGSESVITSLEDVTWRSEKTLFRVGSVTVSDKQLQLAVSPSDSLPDGSYYDNILMNSTQFPFRFAIPVSLRVINPVRLVPTTVRIVLDPTNGKYRPVTLLLLMHNSVAGMWNKVETNDGDFLLEEQDSSTSARRVFWLSVHENTKYSPGETVDLLVQQLGSHPPLALKVLLIK